MGKEASHSYESLQVCRGIAAFLVMLLHLGFAIAAPKYFGIAGFGIPVSFGHTGVEFFFVLSGFIITYVHWNDISRPSALPRYLQRRFVRIYPIYWIVFIGVFLAALAIPETRVAVLHDSGLIFKSLALMPLDLAHTSAAVIVVGWTLEYEVAFYAIFALAIINRWLIVIAVLLLLCTYVSCAHGCEFPASFVAKNITPLFGIGALVAVFERKGWTVRRPIAVVSIATVCFFALGIAEIVDRAFTSTSLQRIFLGLASGLIIAGLVGWEKGKVQKPNFGVLQLLGDASYVLYLVHYPLISALSKICVRLLPRTYFGAAIAYGVILGACLTVAVAVHLWIEKPLLRSLGKMFSTSTRNGAGAVLASRR